MEPRQLRDEVGADSERELEDGARDALGERRVGVPGRQREGFGRWANLGIGLDSYHSFATQTPLAQLDDIDPAKIYLVQLSDFMWQEVRTPQERMETARHFRVFPGEGVHSEATQRMVLQLARMGYRGDYSFEVFNDDYQQLPLDTVAQRARRSATWLAEDVLRRAVPAAGGLRLRELV